MSLKLFAIAVYIFCFAFLLGLLGHACASGIDNTNIPKLSTREDARLKSFPDIRNFGDTANTKFGSSDVPDSYGLMRNFTPRKNQSTFSSKSPSRPGTPFQTPIQEYPNRNSQVFPSKMNFSKFSPGYTAKQTPSIPAMIGPQKTQNRKIPAATPVSDNAKEVVQANNQFGIDFYSQLTGQSENEGKNIFFSPWSISSVLAITHEGARSTTADEIRSVFHFPGSYDTLRQGYLELSKRLNNGKSGVTLNTANALWAEKTYPFDKDYINIADQYYNAKTTNLDFITKPEESRQIINQWVEDQTKGKIKNLLPRDSIDTQKCLIITNAIYFKGTWTKQFDGTKTLEQDFVMDDGTTVKVPMMVRMDEEAEYWYTETDDLQVLGMPYTHKNGKGLSMLVLLPRDNDLEAVEASLSSQSLEALNQDLKYQRVMVAFPRFRIETTYSLKDMLSEMGMPNAFIPFVADLSGMNDGNGNLWIDEVYHKAYVDVNEEGTEAAAATAGVIEMGSDFSFEPIPVFRADHPFMFLIQDNDTGNILFMGRMMNPAGA